MSIVQRWFGVSLENFLERRISLKELGGFGTENPLAEEAG
jgi:hypothetical protein